MEDFKAAVIAKRIAVKCVAFAESIHATRLSAHLVFNEVKYTLKHAQVHVDPEPVFDKVRVELESHGVELRR